MAINYQQFNPEVWGGIECTINRVEDSFRDQLILSGHYNRPDDIEKIASLGIKKLRYPVLWERHQHQEEAQFIDWRFTEEQLNSIRKNNIEPIAGLLHHGSGPAFTDLSDPAFAVKFARYAARVAEKFPWIKFYIPVNEPLTTARFSGLYGYWYPHYQDERSFIQMLLNQLKGTILAMQAIKKINAHAQFIQTEDLSKTHSTAFLQYQACFENERRWLTNDILCGKVNGGHALWKYLIRLGINESELNFFLENSLPPDILGFNYYATSERFLTEEIEKYPNSSPGGNGIHRYVDVEATRSGHNLGLKYLLKEAWNRYKLPIAVTECHLNCTREEQMRWFNECWHSTRELKSEGIPVKGITAWSLFGSYDWNSLLTRKDNYYESGVFDINTNTIRRTALFKMIQVLGQKGVYNHPVLKFKGWWHGGKQNIDDKSCSTRPLCIITTSSNRNTARLLIKLCRQRNLPFLEVKAENGDLYDHEIDSVGNKYHPWAIAVIESFHEFQSKLSSMYVSVTNELLPEPTDVLRLSVQEDVDPETLSIKKRLATGIEQHCNKAIDLLIDSAYGLWMISNNPINTQVSISVVGGQKDDISKNNIPMRSFK